MLYNVATAAVEQLLVAHSPQLAAWWVVWGAAARRGGAWAAVCCQLCVCVCVW